VKRIVNNALAFLNCEAPAAAPDIKPVQDSMVPDTNGPGFAQKLKDCENKLPAEPYKSDTDKDQLPNEEKGDKETEDNGMLSDPSAAVAVYGIVGILEGFEPPGYQSDNTACTGDESIIPLSPQPAAQSVSAAQTASMPQPAEMDKTAEAAENQTQANGEHTGETSEQIARMLQNGDAGTKPAQTQDEVLKIVGDYLDSLENTNSKASGTVDKAGVPGADGVVQSKSAQADEAANAKVSTGELIPAGKVKPEAAQMPEKAETQDVASLKASEEAKAPAPQAAERISPAVKATDTADTTAAVETEASESKPQDTGKAEPKGTSGHANGGAVNAEPAVYKPEMEQAEPVMTVAKPENVRESVLRIVDRVKTEASEGKYDFDIDLKPDFMGKVSIKLTMEDGNVKVQIKAEDSSVKAMLSDQMSNLHYMLKEKGIPVTTVDITNGGDTMSGRQESSGQYERRNPQGNNAYEQPAEGTFEAAKDKYDFYLGGSNVEYLA
jgi:flagellar hook-length control protein FliK